MSWREWDWASFQGSAYTLKLLRRDMPGVDTILAHTPGRSVAVQAGGNLGLWPKRLAEEFGTVHTFELDPETCRMLRANAPESNIIVHEAALGANNKPVALSHARRDGRRHPHEGTHHVSGPGTLPCYALDSLSLPVCDLLCVDVEGWEFHVLEGAVETLARCKPVVTLEFNDNVAAMKLTPEMIVDFLRAHGYERLWLPEAEQATLYADQMFVPAERIGEVAA